MTIASSSASSESKRNVLPDLQQAASSFLTGTTGSIRQFLSNRTSSVLATSQHAKRLPKIVSDKARDVAKASSRTISIARNMDWQQMKNHMVQLKEKTKRFRTKVNKMTSKKFLDAKRSKREMVRRMERREARKGEDKKVIEIPYVVKRAFW